MKESDTVNLLSFNGQVTDVKNYILSQFYLSDGRKWSESKKDEYSIPSPTRSGHRPSSVVLSDGAQAQRAQRGEEQKGEGEWKLQQPFYKAAWKQGRDAHSGVYIRNQNSLSRVMYLNATINCIITTI